MNLLQIDQRIKRIEGIIDRLQDRLDQYQEEKTKIETKKITDPFFEMIRGIAMAPLDVRDIEKKYQKVD